MQSLYCFILLYVSFAIQSESVQRFFSLHGVQSVLSLFYFSRNNYLQVIACFLKKRKYNGSLYREILRGNVQNNEHQQETIQLIRF